MSRAINVDLPPNKVIALCAKHKAAVSSVEPLPNGATRVVLVNADGAALMRAACAKNVLPEGTRRFSQWSVHRELQ